MHWLTHILVVTLMCALRVLQLMQTTFYCYLHLSVKLQTMLDICRNVETKYNLSVNRFKLVCGVFDNCSLNSFSY